MKNLNEIISSLDDYIEWAEANIYEVPICLPDDLREIKNYLLDRKPVNFPFSIGTIIWSKEPFEDGIARKGNIIEYEIDEENIYIWVDFDPESITVEFDLKDFNKTWFLDNRK